MLLIYLSPPTIDVSNSCAYRDVHRCHTDVSLVDRLLRLNVLYFPPPFYPHTNPGRSGGSFDTYPTPRGRTSNSTDPKRVFAAPIPLPKPVEVAVHRSFNDYPPVKTVRYASYGLDSADSLSKSTHPC